MSILQMRTLRHREVKWLTKVTKRVKGRAGISGVGTGRVCALDRWAMYPLCSWRFLLTNNCLPGQWLVWEGHIPTLSNEMQATVWGLGGGALGKVFSLIKGDVQKALSPLLANVFMVKLSVEADTRWLAGAKPEDRGLCTQGGCARSHTEPGSL